MIKRKMILALIQFFLVSWKTKMTHFRRKIGLLILSLVLPSCGSTTLSSISSFSSENNSNSSSINSISSESLPVSSSGDSLFSSSSSVETSSEINNSSSETYSSSSAIQEPSYYDGYYDSLKSWENGEDLKNQLYNIIRDGYQPLSYIKSVQNYDTNIHADHTKYDFEYLDVVYSPEAVYKTRTNTGWQREHAFCASLMCGSLTANAVKNKGRATDFHNLFASSTNGNTSRGNKNYGYANPFDLTYKDRTVDEGNDGYSYDSKTFEPADYDKGRLARAIFYMGTMYKDDELDTINNINMKGLRIVEEPVDYAQGSYDAFAIGNLNDLLEWNQDYAVDYLEMQHNLAVYTDTDNLDGYAQGNRNPYIDFPGLVDYVYGAKKDQPGTIDDVVASASYLDSENHDSISHYAIKEAKREYGFNTQIENSDIKVVAVRKDYSYEEVFDFNNSLDRHVFSEDDGDIVDVVVTTRLNDINYQIVLNPMAMCSSDIINLDKTGINDKLPNEEQEVSWADYSFLFSFTTTYSKVTTDGMTLSNDNQKGGFYLGSGTKNLTGLTLKTKESYTIDQAYIKAYAGNKSSSFNLIIKVGDTILLKSTNVSYNEAQYKLYGGKVDTPLTGQVSFIFQGSNKLYLNSIAFNAIIA